jgi:hypothetical protein
MAFYVRINKIAENEAVASYRFEGDLHRTGSFDINKQTGEISLVEPMPGDEKGHAFSRAAAKIMKEWKQGSLPETAEWAS